MDTFFNYCNCHLGNGPVTNLCKIVISCKLDEIKEGRKTLKKLHQTPVGIKSKSSEFVEALANNLLVEKIVLILTDENISLKEIQILNRLKSISQQNIKVLISNDFKSSYLLEDNTASVMVLLGEQAQMCSDPPKRDCNHRCNH